MQGHNKMMGGGRREVKASGGGITVLINYITYTGTVDSTVYTNTVSKNYPIH